METIVIFIKFLLLEGLLVSSAKDSANFPLIISTWATKDFQAAAQKAFDELTFIPISMMGSYRRINALVEGLSECERRQCDRTVGYGGSPDEKGETTLDSLLMDGPGHRTGAVAALRRVKSIARVAWAVMNYTEHSLLVGEKGTEFALSMGFKEEELTTPESIRMHQQWLEQKCQPNFWKNVHPDPRTICGPYRPDWQPIISPKPSWKSILFDASTTMNRFSSTNFKHLRHTLNNADFFDETNHDTIGMIVLDEQHNLAAGTSSNGARNKIPGRVGDSPIVGAGAYVDNEVGAAAATGDGDVMMRFMPSFLAVEQMRNGKQPVEAAKEAIRRIKKYYPKFFGAIIVANMHGDFGASCSGMKTFSYSVVNPKNGGTVRVQTVRCEQ